MGLEAWFFDTRGAMWRYVLRMTASSLVPAILMALLLGAVGVARDGTVPEFDPQVGPVMLFVGLVVISPLLETFLMALFLAGLARVFRGPARAALASAIVWAILHSLVAPAWGFVVLSPFFVFSCAYLAWRRRSRWHGLLVAASIHMLHNSIPGLLLLAAA
jgi:membrane protease YdiL (CAAX protease family)